MGVEVVPGEGGWLGAGARLERCQQSQGDSIHMPRPFISRNACSLPQEWFLAGIFLSYDKLLSLEELASGDQ